jgi:rhamnogalacturonyl hydrolase YesR
MMKRFFIMAAALGIFLSAAAQEHRALVWSDEFDYKGLPDPKKWGYEDGFIRNQEPQYYTLRRLENARVDSGMLIIEARKETYGNAHYQPGGNNPEKAEYTSASLVTQGKASWKYGRIEVRAKVPGGAGSWPAIWLLGADREIVKWPFCGEVDIMEYLGKDPNKVYGTVHYADAKGKYAHQGEAPTVAAPADGFHTYALDWYPDRLEFYYDSLKYFVFDISKADQGQGKENIFQKPFYLLLNLALGHQGSWAGPVDQATLPMRYYIDYVRVYQDSVEGPGEETLKLMRTVANWQLQEWKTKGPKYPVWDWVNGAAYTGYDALADIDRDTTYTNAMLRVGETLHWNTGPSRTMADDYCVGQNYDWLYAHYGDARMIRSYQALADSIAVLPHTEALQWGNRVQLREWAWCDALFMGPPGLAMLSKVTGNPKYLDLANKLWWKTTDYLYSPKDSLYYRDSRYFTQKEANGTSMFWGRGNGWVMAGLVRMLQSMPLNYADRPKYLKLFGEMAAKIAAIQQPDGTWHASLLDPGSYPNKETSGTAFYCYALAWGVHHGLLDSTTYGSVITKAWNALVSAIQPDGRLGYVQQIGDKPGQTDASSTEAYGTGGFLLAGSEIYKMQAGQ